MSPPWSSSIDPTPKAYALALQQLEVPAAVRVRTLGEAALAWSLDQYERNNPPTAEDVASWFEPAERDGERLGLSSGNACAVAACAAAFRTCRSYCELVPHGYRASAKELMYDAAERGAFLSRTAVLNEGLRPHVGDLAIYDRSYVDRPDTEWFGHVDRVISVDADGYQNLGANEAPHSGWAIDWSAYTNDRLLGFVLYPQRKVFGFGALGWFLVGGGAVAAGIYVARRRRRPS